MYIFFWLLRNFHDVSQAKKFQEKKTHKHFVLFDQEKKNNSLFLYLPLYFARKLGIDDDEIQRQNRITAQIVANYLERRLFPFKRPTHRLPTVDEILPTTSFQQNDQTAESKMKITRQLGTNNGQPTDDDIGDEDYANDDNQDSNDPENLQSVESNHVDSYYPEMNDSISNDNEGRC